MNIAFQALVIFALVLPGLLARYSYKKGFGDRSPEVRPLSEEIAYSLVFACLTHAVAGPIAHQFRPIDLEALAVILTGEYGKDSIYLDRTLAALTGSPFVILWYLIGTSAIGVFSGLGLHYIVRKKKLDLKHSFLRFDNHWQYLLDGEIAEFEETTTLPSSFDMIVVTCLTELNGEAYLYSGALEKSFYNSKGELELLVFLGAVRKKLGAGDEKQTIKAEYLCLKMGTVSNLAVKFVALESSTPA